MKPTTIAKSALALALGTVACAAYADLTENFDAIAVGTAIVGQTSNSLTWSGAGDASYVTNNPAVSASDRFLQVQTEGATLTATIAETETNTLNTALTAGRDVTFSCTAKLEPTDSLEDISGTDVKFALYAYANNGATNLVVYGINPSHGVATNNVTSIALTGDEVAIEVTITNAANAKGFTVKVGSSVAGPFGLASNSEISALDITGNGTIDDIAFAAAAAGYVADDEVAISGDPAYELSAEEANYLNGILASGDKATLEAKLADMTVEDFNEAFSLNTDIIADDGAPAYTFNITSIRPNASNVDVTIVLDRTHGLGAINGTLKFYASANGTTWGEPKSYEITNDHFATGDIATLSVPKGDGNFFKATIE